jgi:hypothetical protein
MKRTISYTNLSGKRGQVSDPMLDQWLSRYGRQTQKKYS